MGYERVRRLYASNTYFIRAFYGRVNGASATGPDGRLLTLNDAGDALKY
jgi:hypothetical protein